MHSCEHCDEHDMIPGAVAQRFKDERNMARTELDHVIETALSAGIPRVVDGWQRGANDLVAALVHQMSYLEESVAEWSAAAHGHVDTIEEMHADNERLRMAMARALERCEVADDPSGAASEAAMILGSYVNLDGSKKEE